MVLTMKIWHIYIYIYIYKYHICVTVAWTEFPWLKYYCILLSRCEPFDTYPRTYDLLHAAGLLSIEKKRYAQIFSLFFQLDDFHIPVGQCFWLFICLLFCSKEKTDQEVQLHVGFTNCCVWLRISVVLDYKQQLDTTKDLIWRSYIIARKIM